MSETDRPHLPPHAVETIHAFLRAHALAGGSTGVVVGLSGGIDSALVARLARDALGPAHVLGVLLPDAHVPPELLEETVGFARGLGIAHRTIPIDALEAAFRAALPDVNDRVTLGNTAARIRMTVLYAVAREARRLVAGTGNKSELLLGYFTKYGDGGVDLLPIGDLYKTDVWALAETLGLPKAVRERTPTAGFWVGQTDEGELGLPYRDVDRILRRLELLEREEEIVRETGLPAATVRGLLARVDLHRHKRRLPPVAKVGLRTVGLDWRE
ncbi:MAG TPA: NAD+ synthase [Thermoplasmata archaeon]|nr:NAD+ synthase [Thermoplasmata archaeon]